MPSLQLLETVPLPPLLHCQHFVNLTNGIEVIPQLQRLGLPFRCPACACMRLLPPTTSAPTAALGPPPPANPLPLSSAFPLLLPRSFVRIQSTACEQQHFERLMQGLDATLLLQLALGHTCLVYDLGSRNKKRGAPRAIWYGLEFARYALTRWVGVTVAGRERRKWI